MVAIFNPILGHFHDLFQSLVACIMHFRNVNVVTKVGVLEDSSITDKNQLWLDFICAVCTIKNDYAIDLQMELLRKTLFLPETASALYIYMLFENVPFLASKKGWKILWIFSACNNILKNLSLIPWLYRVWNGPVLACKSSSVQLCTVILLDSFLQESFWQLAGKCWCLSFYKALSVLKNRNVKKGSEFSNTFKNEWGTSDLSFLI